MTETVFEPTYVTYRGSGFSGQTSRQLVYTIPGTLGALEGNVENCYNSGPYLRVVCGLTVGTGVLAKRHV